MAFKMHTLSLYRKLLREGSKFSAYNYRQYAIRRVKDAFREYQHVNDAATLQQLIAQAEVSLKMLQRQVLVNSMYQGSQLIIEDEER
jgi:hypothetical protein